MPLDENGNPIKIRTHIWRHTYGYKLAELGVDDNLIAKLLGHSNTKTLKNYRKLSNDIMAEKTKPFIDYLAGTDKLRLGLLAGKTPKEIMASFPPVNFKTELLYK